MIPAIEITNLSKKYRKGSSSSYLTLRDKLAGIFHTRKSAKLDSDEFWALKDINLKIMPGEVVGIIGRNGAGKSTLLKILSRITHPTEGEVFLRGRVGSLLEVGTGFHQELSGRENIYLNGAVLGMSRKEVKRKFDEIVSFAEIGEFIDTPVKHYSSGMYMRLAFAVAAHLETEILLVDEVLAVGDMAFQQKCLGKISEIAKLGRTIIFVSHNLGAIENLCSSALVLEGGVVTVSGKVEKVIDSYMSQSQPISSFNKRSGPLNLSFKMTLPSGEKTNTIQVGEELQFNSKLISDTPLHSFEFGIGIEDIFGTRICTFHSHYQLKQKISFTKKCEITINWSEVILTPGRYRLIAASYNGGELIAHWENIEELNVVEGDFYDTGKLPDASHQGNILVKSIWTIHEK